MNRLLDRKELDKMSSTEGIVSLLCDIPDFNVDEYELMEPEVRELVDYTLNINLLSPSQISCNLRRSMDNGNLALINQQRLTALALLYFGIKDKSGKFFKYICPYTGKEYKLEEIKYELAKNYKDRNLDKILELEHIMPHSSGGGTILFNCIPASREANSSAEKGNLHLLDWLTNPESSGYKYYQNGGTERLEKLINYMISALEISFEAYKEVELNFEYNTGIHEQDGIDNDENFENERKVVEKSAKIRKTSIEGYIPFLNQLINQVEKEGYNTTEIKNRLSKLEKNGIINQLNKYKIVQATIEELFEKENPKSYLTYSLNINYLKLVNSIKTDKNEEIKNVITRRFEQIKQLVKVNRKSINDYFSSLKDLEDTDLLYKDKISEKEIENFISNIKLGHDGKIKLFIEMLSEDEYTQYEKGKPNSNNIFAQTNQVAFKGYEKIEGLNTSYFWNCNSTNIKERIQKQLHELRSKESPTEEEKIKLEKLEKAEKAVDCFEFYANIERRIDSYIEMLSEDEYTQYEKGKPNSNNIFAKTNQVAFKGYEKIEGLNTSHFWSCNSTKIKEKIKKQLQELRSKESPTEEEKIKLEKLEKAGKAVDCYEFYSNIERRLDCYIEMLSEDEYTQYEKEKPNSNNIFAKTNQVAFKGYEKIEGLNTSYFWSHNSTKIIAKLFFNKDEQGKKLEKDYSGQEYDKARKAILNYAKVNNIDEYIEKINNKEKKNTLASLRENASNLTVYDIEKAGKLVRGILNNERDIA